MVAKIESGKSLIGALNYNERKVKAGKAKLIMAQLYPKDAHLLSFHDKLFRLVDLASRNQRTKTNTVHLSLNFDLSENLVKETLCKIADAYMEKIGFGNQPYLVYQHFDAGHNHIHILATNIDADGQRISLHNIGKLKSEPARKAIELEFGLIQAEKQQKAMAAITNIKPLIYGADDTKRTLSNIVNHVAQGYKFTSIPELNAVLAIFNVMVDRGAKDTVMFKNGGLRYWALDTSGNKTGVPIKASSINKRPTLKLLEERFRLNEYLRKPFKTGLISTLDTAFQRARSHLELKDVLGQKSVHMVIRANDEGRVYGLTFVDLQNKVVFNGSDLGKGYSAAAVEARLKGNLINPTTQCGAELEDFTANTTGQDDHTVDSDLLLSLLSPVDQSGNQNLFERKRKKKRRRLNL